MVGVRRGGYWNRIGLVNVKEGLIGNIGFLYRMMCELKSTGYNVVVVGKAFDDDLIRLCFRQNQRR
jgi:hypothetical protein